MDYICLLLAILLSVLGCSVSSTVHSCNDDADLLCGSKEFHDTLNEDGFSLLNEETLAQHCSDIVEDIECKKNYLSRCNPEGVEAFALATDGIKDVLADLCDNTTDIRKSYRTHSSCISSASEDYEDCILNNVDSAVDPEDYDSSENDIVSHDATIRRLCRFYDPFKNCMTGVTRRICGDSAAQLVEQLIVRMATPAVSTKCLSKSK